MELKKELPNITKLQEGIIEFWEIRGYDNITHTLGLNISLHKKPEYECLGLNLQYLEQFYNKTNEDTFMEVERFFERMLDWFSSDDDEKIEWRLEFKELKHKLTR